MHLYLCTYKSHSKILSFITPLPCIIKGSYMQKYKYNSVIITQRHSAGKANFQDVLPHLESKIKRSHSVLSKHCHIVYYCSFTMDITTLYFYQPIMLNTHQTVSSSDFKRIPSIVHRFSNRI